MSDATRAEMTDEADLDPHIRAFEILSDRVSNLEDGIAAIRRSQQSVEMRKFGELDGSLFGLPPHCRLERLDDLEEELENVPEEVSRRLPSQPTLYMRGAVIEIRCKCCECKIPSRDVRPDLVDILDGLKLFELDPCEKYNIVSQHEFISHELSQLYLERQIRAPGFKWLQLRPPAAGRFRFGCATHEEDGERFDKYVDLAIESMRYHQDWKCCVTGIRIAQLEPEALTYSWHQQWSHCKLLDAEKVQEHKERLDVLCEWEDYVEKHPLLVYTR